MVRGLKNTGIALLLVGVVFVSTHTTNATTFSKEDNAGNIIGVNAQVVPPPNGGNNHVLTVTDVVEAGVDAADLKFMLSGLGHARAVGAPATAADSWFQLPRSHYNLMHQPLELLETHVLGQHGPGNGHTKILTNSRLPFLAPVPGNIAAPAGFTAASVAGRVVFPGVPGGAGGPPPLLGALANGTVVTASPAPVTVGGGGPLVSINHTVQPYHPTRGKLV